MDSLTKISPLDLKWRSRVFDSLSFPTLIIKPNQEVISANQRFLEKFKVTIDQVIGKTCRELQHVTQDSCQEDTCPLKRVLRDKKGHSSIKRIYDANGQQRWEDRVFSPILDEDGEVMYILESVRDITRIKTLEKTLRETEDFLEKIIQSSASAIMAADMNGELLFANKAAQELLGYTERKEVLKLTVVNLYPPGKANEIMKMLRDEKIGGPGKLPSTNTTVINIDGEEIPVEITASIIYEEGREVATMAIFNDLREKIAAEEKLKAARFQLAQAEKMASLGQLAAGVAHEINNPLTGILFYAEMARETLPDDHPLKEDLEYIVEDVYRCREIVKNLLAYSRQQAPTLSIFQINDLVNRSLNLIRDQKVFTQVKVVKQFSAEMMLVNVDNNQLSQVIINLVMNALAAMKGQGTLTIRTSRNKTLGQIYLEVEDTGCGIPTEHLSKVFDPFFTTSELGQGTGLGLSTAYGLLQENGGKIEIKKTGPQGTTFLITLPQYRSSVKEDDIRHAAREKNIGFHD